MLLGAANRTINSDEFTILVYDWNIASGFSCDQSSLMLAPDESSHARGNILSASLAGRNPMNADDVVSVLIRNRGTQVLAGQGPWCRKRLDYFFRGNPASLRNPSG